MKINLIIMKNEKDVGLFKQKKKGLQLFYPERSRNPVEECEYILEHISLAKGGDYNCLNIYTLRQTTPTFIGHMINDNRLDYWDIDVHIINGNVTKASYDKQGKLNGLPFGFFEIQNALYKETI